ncbi:MAG: phenylalanine--tRNA ligase subunit beta [bacterium]|nr:phenylalanine--tRNA ligase subunit beta [bacterium]
MKVPYRWLTKLVKLKSNPAELAQKLSLMTIGVDEVKDTPLGPVLDLDVTYNRGDLLSMVGVAREAAFIDKAKLTLPDASFDLNNIPDANLQIQRDQTACQLYTAVILEVSPTPSPEWLQQRLASVGITPQNIIVDLTNLVMWEWGQPFHAFDLDTLTGETISIKPAGRSLKFTTLDNKTRTLDPDDILIWDDQKPIALAGVMGGLETEITNQTQTVLLEMALFDPFQIRRTAMKHGLFSDAANRFIHKPSPQTSQMALKRILTLFAKHAKAKIKGIKISGSFDQSMPVISLTLDQVNSLLGADISLTQAADILTGLDFKLAVKKHNLIVTPPHWRQDIQIKQDVIEEIARGFGYWRLKPSPLPLHFIPHKPAVSETLSKQIKNFLTGQGLFQINPFGFYTQAEITHFGIQTKPLVRVTNFISIETRYLKSSLLPGLYSYIKTSRPINWFDQPLGFFEINRTYHRRHQKPDEPVKLAFIFDSQNFLTRIINNLFEYLRFDYQHLRLKAQTPPDFPLTSHFQHLHTLFYKNKPLGWLVQLDDFWAVELDWLAVLTNADLTPKPSKPSSFAPIIEELTFEPSNKPELLFNLLISLRYTTNLIKELRLIDRYQNRFTIRIIYHDPHKQLAKKDIKPLRRQIASQAQKQGYKLIGQEI